MSIVMKKFGDIAEFVRNGASIKQDDSAGGLKITRIETIANRIVDLNKCGYADLSVNDYINYRLKCGDILISHINSEKHLGKCAIFELDRDDIVHGMNLLALRTNKIADSKYVYHYLNSKKFLSLIPKITKKSVNQASFTVTAFKELEIPLPPLEEQKRIAAILDKADAIRQKRQQAIELADEFLRSVFLDMFGDPVTNPKGWEVVTLASRGTFKNGLNFGKGESGTSIRCLGVGDFKSLTTIDNMESLSSIDLDVKPTNEYLLKDGDLLFVRSNGNKSLVGRCVSVYPKLDKVTFSGFCIRYRIESSELESYYLNYLFHTPSIKKEMLKGGQGANIQNINQKTLSAIKIPVPPKDLQITFSNIVTMFKQSEINNMQHRSELEKLISALSSKAFSGQL